MVDIEKLYPRTGDKQTAYLKSVITDPATTVGDYTIYSDFVSNPVGFEKNGVLHHYPINRDRLIIRRLCSVACGAKFLFNNANHILSSPPTYPFPLFFKEWGPEKRNVAESWGDKGDIVSGDDVWMGYKVVIMVRATIGDGVTIGARVVMTKNVPPCAVTDGIPAKPTKKWYPEETIAAPSELK